ncbi:two-component system response regulator [Methyloceanibacter marginalis]|uniref:Two-component system response regulator n=1 Tax=Methyloceanibacter marginalis TaxID=1774971 RepID=A0A1E3WBX6_9HYPH|nr:ANTAR domain-containing protein [Methyloceanibacter marginalis]ODS03318.1 two-component system response regulator [Methyloceanibacter marginalis]
MSLSVFDSADSTLKILVIDETPIRRAILESGLKEAGFVNVTMLDSASHLVEQIYKLDPDVILIDLENPSRDVLEQMFQVSRAVRRPIAMFVEQSDKATIEEAIDAGVSAYIVDGLKKERVKPILEMTVSRFKAFDRLRTELEETKSALKDRKVIEKAKGILMRSRDLSEDEAYGLLRKTAMGQGKRLADVAEGLVSSFELLKE